MKKPLMMALALLYIANPASAEIDFTPDDKGVLEEVIGTADLMWAIYATKHTNQKLMKDSYNIAVLFDDDEDEYKKKRDVERLLGNSGFPYKLRRQNSLERMLKKNNIKKEQFVDDPLKYSEQMRQNNLDGILCWGYSPLLKTSVKNTELAAITADYAYYSFTHEKKDSGKFISATSPGLAKVMAGRIEKSIKRWEREDNHEEDEEDWEEEE